MEKRKNETDNSYYCYKEIQRIKKQNKTIIWKLGKLGYFNDISIGHGDKKCWS